MKNFCMILSLIITFALGWFANEALQTQKIYAAAKPLEYKIIGVPGLNPRVMEKTLNTYGQQGWRLHSVILEASFLSAKPPANIKQRNHYDHIRS
jgi:hypothetical protein